MKRILFLLPLLFALIVSAQPIPGLPGVYYPVSKIDGNLLRLFDSASKTLSVRVAIDSTTTEMRIWDKKIDPPPIEIGHVSYIDTSAWTARFVGSLTETKIAKLNAVVWNPNNGSTHAIIFLPGLGGEGTTYSRLYSEGLPVYLKNGSLKLSDYVFAIQHPSGWPNAIAVNNMIADVLARYPAIKTIALTGLSAGAAGIFNATEQGKYRSIITSVVAFSMDRGDAVWPTEPYANIKFWGISGNTDSRTWRLRDFVTALKAKGYAAQFTEYNGGHSGWNTYYNPSWKDPATGQTVYEFLSSGSVKPPPVVVPPTKKVTKIITIYTDGTVDVKDPS